MDRSGEGWTSSVAGLSDLDDQQGRGDWTHFDVLERCSRASLLRMKLLASSRRANMPSDFFSICLFATSSEQSSFSAASKTVPLS